MSVTLFPTSAPDGFSRLPWWRDGYFVVHHIAAALLFSSFILFSIWLFRKSKLPRRSDRDAEKRRRDAVCLACGLVMIAAVLWAAIVGLLHYGDPDVDILWPESIAVWAFAVSWLAKGDVHGATMRLATGLARRFTSASSPG